METYNKIPAYRIMTTVSSEGMIHLPLDLIELYNHTVEILVIEKKAKPLKGKLHFPTYKCKGKIKEFTREEIYGTRL
ncbi:MAG: hypothetical protein KBF93_08255 [Leptospiraceae bacterium]|nr:hypothetical protein [Leptospiraceae bacterium]